MRVNILRKKGLVLAFLLSISVAGLVLLPVHGDQTSAQTELNSARLKLINCYVAARAAESASANISQLTSTLNDAGLLFARAESAYSNGDFDGAQSLAAQSQNELSNFVSTANSLQVGAEQRREQDFLFNFVGSIAGTIVVIVGAAVLWVLLKRRYGTEESVKA